MMRLPRHVYRVPEGDNRPRQVCSDCGFINYENPRVVVGTLSTWEGKILMCKRAIEPREGYWTLPAGYLEQKETTAAGAIRETLIYFDAHREEIFSAPATEEES